MRRTTLALTLTTAALALGALLPGVAAADTALTGTVGPSFSISLVDAAGKKVEHLDPGTYTISVHDRSVFHNFHLSGPGGVSKSTEIETEGDVTWTVTLVDGKYSVVCDPHAELMVQEFTVGMVAPEPAPAAVPAKGAPAAKPAVTTKAPVVKKPVVKAPVVKAPVVKKPAAKKPVAPAKTTK